MSVCGAVWPSVISASKGTALAIQLLGRELRRMYSLRHLMAINRYYLALSN